MTTKDFTNISKALLREVAVDGPSMPNEVIEHVRQQCPGATQAEIRGTLWSLINGGEIQSTWSGELLRRSPKV